MTISSSLNQFTDQLWVSNWGRGEGNRLKIFSHLLVKYNIYVDNFVYLTNRFREDFDSLSMIGLYYIQKLYIHYTYKSLVKFTLHIDKILHNYTLRQFCPTTPTTIVQKRLAHRSRSFANGIFQTQSVN